MDNQSALELFKNGGVVVCLEFPKGVHVGIDLMSYQSGPEFRGIKMIPAGFHVFYVSQTEDSVRSSIMLHLSRGEVVVLEWNRNDEEFRILEKDSPRCKEIAASVHRFEMDRHLGPYPLDLLSRWQRMTSLVTVELVRRVEPSNGLISADTDSSYLSEMSSIVGSSAGTTEPNPLRGKSLHFTKLRGVGKGSRAWEVTAYAIDTTRTLLSLLCDQKMGLRDILGELQLSYVLFLLSQSYSALEQWKRLFDTLCRAEDFLIKPQLVLFSSYLAEKKEQLDSQRMDEDSSGEEVDKKAENSSQGEDPTQFIPKPSAVALIFQVLCAQVEELPDQLIAEGFSGNDMFLVRSLESLHRVVRQYKSRRTVNDLKGESSENQSILAENTVLQSIETLLDCCERKLGWIPKLEISEDALKDWDGYIHTTSATASITINADSLGDDYETSTSNHVHLSGETEFQNQEQFSTLEELLASLAQEGGDGDLPTIVGVH